MKRYPPYRLLLINPWIYDFTAFDLWSKPVGLLYIAAYLREIGYDIDFIDCLDRYHPLLSGVGGQQPVKLKKYGTGHYHRQIITKPQVIRFVPRNFARYGLPEEIFIQQLRSLPSPDAVLVTSFMTYWYLGPLRAIEIIRQIYPAVPVILGGIYATLLPEHARDHLKPDDLITGPGEIKVEECLAGLFKDAPRAKKTVSGLDDFPSPAFDLYHRLDYLPVMTSRGCPYRCTFCAADKISGPYAQRHPEAVSEEIITGVKRYRIQDVAFYDDALLLNKNKRMIPILEQLIRSELSFRFHTPNGLHARQIDHQLAQLFRRSGFCTIRLSFETINPQRSTDMNDKISPDDLVKAVECLEAAGYQRKSLEAYILTGLPGQEFAEVYRSIGFVHSLGVKVRLASFSPIAGTVDYQRSIESGFFPSDADPLLTNKSIFPLHRNLRAYRKFQQIKQLTTSLNQIVERGSPLYTGADIETAILKSDNQTDC